ncbi:MAG: fumarylacetoacetate hydrolase family protein [Gemmataceae bacterium]|nr:fumarylacetoacetate hydrolase family protein [Gemmataceae bacterium]MDW8266898.1 fumarylacetoacetate hydrolase family protein [Gemmataceae bacterium]
MRICRYQHNGQVEAALYFDARIASVGRLAAELGVKLPTAMSANLLDYLPPDGPSAEAAQELYRRFNQLPPADQQRLSQPTQGTRLRVPVPEPKKVILLAGNYAAHIEEGGREKALERQQTYPYFFWKPPSTTLTDPGAPVRIPKVSPHSIDWEIELGVIIGRKCKDVSEKEALGYVAGYSVCNDISDRNFQLNPRRKPREKDGFFDWLHGKWHDTFLPMGPCVLSASVVPDPQKFPLKLKVNGQVMQDANTAQMIFPVAALVSILSSFVTLEPGDIISTGTPSGVGAARKPPVFLKPGDQIEAEIGGIGILYNPVV